MHIGRLIFNPLPEYFLAFSLELKGKEGKKITNSNRNPHCGPRTQERTVSRFLPSPFVHSLRIPARFDC